MVSNLVLGHTLCPRQSPHLWGLASLLINYFRMSSMHSIIALVVEILFLLFTGHPALSLLLRSADAKR